MEPPDPGTSTSRQDDMLFFVRKVSMDIHILFASGLSMLGFPSCFESAVGPCR